MSCPPSELANADTAWAIFFLVLLSLMLGRTRGTADHMRGKQKPTETWLANRSEYRRPARPMEMARLVIYWVTSKSVDDDAPTWAGSLSTAWHGTPAKRKPS